VQGDAAIYSVAEHVYDLVLALQTCYNLALLSECKFSEYLAVLDNLAKVHVLKKRNIRTVNCLDVLVIDCCDEIEAVVNFEGYV